MDGVCFGPTSRRTDVQRDGLVVEVHLGGCLFGVLVLMRTMYIAERAR